MPSLARLSFALIALGLLADVALHAAALDPAAGHLAIFFGMLAAVSSVARQGISGGRTKASQGAHLN